MRLELHGCKNSNFAPSGEGVCTITDASAPFDDPNADAILRASDNVDFRVIRTFLSYGSEFFSDLFSLPQAAGSAGDRMKNGLPVLRMTEEGRTLRTFLLMCYPMGAVDPPVLKRLEDVASLLEAATKYNLGRVEQRARQMLVDPRFLSADPVRVFEIACRYGMKEEAGVAAKATLKMAILKSAYGPELEFISAGNFFQLLQYHRRCIAAAREASGDFIWPTAPNTSQYCTSCTSSFADTNTRKSTASSTIAAILRNRLPHQTDIKNMFTKTATCPHCLTSRPSSWYLTLTNLDELTQKFCGVIENAVSVVSTSGLLVAPLEADY